MCIANENAPHVWNRAGRGSIEVSLVSLVRGCSCTLQQIRADLTPQW